MLITEVFDRILLRSGQFILRKKKVEIDIDAFRILIEDVFAVYSKAHPYTKHYEDVDIINPRQFTFTENFDADLGRIPDWLTEVTPIRSAAASRYVSQSFFSTPALNPNEIMNPPEAVDPTQAPWIYRKPVLTVPFASKYYIKAAFNHWIQADTDENTGETVYSLPTITTDDNVFFDLLKGYFLEGVGRSRRAFTMSDLPILMDADQIASEGREIIEDVMENKIQNVQKFFDAWG